MYNKILVEGHVTIPRHSGTNGSGVPDEAVEEFILLVKNGVFTEQQIQQALDQMCASATKEEWDRYVPMLAEKLSD